MQYSTDDLINGYEAGIVRAQSKFTLSDEPLSVPDSVKKILEESLSVWPYECSPDFVRLFSELVITASIAREINQEAPLSIDDVIAFLGVSSSFFNSFKHR